MVGVMMKAINHTDSPKLDWNTTRQTADTHSVNDGVVTYFAAAPDLMLSEVATQFLRGNDCQGEIEFSVTELESDETGFFRGERNGEAYQA